MKIVFLALSAAALAAAAQPGNWADFNEEWANSPEYEASKALCRSVRALAPPASDRPTAQQRAALRGCSSEDLYYGIGRPADPERARLCAFIEAEEAEDEGTPTYPFSGRTMLMTIYANGAGARRDLDRAIRLACEVEGAPAESHARVSHLAELRAASWTGDDFHYCDDITSGISGGYCAGHRAAIAGARRDAEIARIAARFTPAQWRSFAALREAHAAYADARAESEVDLSGTLRVALQISEQESLRDEFAEVLRRLEAGEAPPVGSAEFRAADAALNAAYRRARRADHGEGPGAVTPFGIRRAQRAWLRYRDAFLAFASLRYPNVPRDSLAAWLTRQRTGILGPAEY